MNLLFRIFLLSILPLELSGQETKNLTFVIPGKNGYEMKQINTTPGQKRFSLWF